MLGYEYNVQPYFLQEFMTPSSEDRSALREDNQKGHRSRGLCAGCAVSRRVTVPGDWNPVLLQERVE